MSSRRVEVELGDRSYEVRVGSGVLGSVASSVRSIVGDDSSRAFVVVDTGVPERFADGLIQGLCDRGFDATRSRITPSEQVKSIETYHRLLVEIASSGHTRVDPVIALGGGVVGDLSGFVASSYQRGVPVFQCPTTLLSMVDASVGGKTGVNLSIGRGMGKEGGAGGDGGEVTLLKNLVGAFHQPSLVVADMDVLESLDARHRKGGLAECVKHGMIASGLGDDEHAGLLDWMIAHLDEIGRDEPTVIEELVARNVALKASVVASDEQESTHAKAGGRMLLNFGHTFGHAIETLAHLSPDPENPDLAPLNHGEAVALGMVAACNAGVELGVCESSLGDELVSILSRLGLPTRVAGLPATGEIIERMMRDKKAAGGALRVILPIQRGKCEIVRGVEPAVLGAGIDSIRA